MKIAVRADSFSAALSHLRECGIEKFTSCKKVGGEYIFRVVIGGDL